MKICGSQNVSNLAPTHFIIGEMERIERPHILLED
jgi:hypothetical protein